MFTICCPTTAPSPPSTPVVTMTNKVDQPSLPSEYQPTMPCILTKMATSRHPLPTHFCHITMTKRVATPHSPCHGDKQGTYHPLHSPKRWVAMLVHAADAACHVTTFAIDLSLFCHPSLGQTQTVHQPLWSSHLSQCLPLIRHPSLVHYPPPICRTKAIHQTLTHQRPQHFSTTPLPTPSIHAHHWILKDQDGIYFIPFPAFSSTTTTQSRTCLQFHSSPISHSGTTKVKVQDIMRRTSAWLGMELEMTRVTVGCLEKKTMSHKGGEDCDGSAL